MRDEYSGHTSRVGSTVARNTAVVGDNVRVIGIETKNPQAEVSVVNQPLPMSSSTEVQRVVSANLLIMGDGGIVENIG
jgi:hypothetical protein